MTSPSSSASSSVSADVAAGKLPDDMPPQLEISTWCTNWEAYDVPRIWSSIKDEVQEDAWTQATGFENLSTLLADHHDRLRALRESLVQSWDPAVSSAAQFFLNDVDALLGALRDDAYAHASTARGLHGVLDALKAAKAEIAVTKAKWDAVTTDLTPEWWDRAAEKLNTKARTAMTAMDSSVSDHRKRIVMPAPHNLHAKSGVDTTITPTNEGDDDTNAGQAGGSAGSSAHGQSHALRPSRPPSLPGQNPVLIPPESPPLSGEVTPPVAAPGGAPSALPIPPGSPYAPTGGAYILPNPITGQGGRTQFMPVPSAMRNEVAAARALAARETGTRGVAPIPIGGGMASGARSNDARLPKREGDIQWEVRQGVPPVIGERTAEEEEADKQKEGVAAMNDVFEEWYANLMTPWDKRSTGAESVSEERL